MTSLTLQEADISGMGFAIDYEQYKEVDISYPPILTQLKMIVPVGVEESRLFAFVRPFQPLVRTNLNSKINSIHFNKWLNTSDVRFGCSSLSL